MIDQIMDFMSFDELDLSFDADQHELDSCCLPSLMEDSFGSAETLDDDDSEVMGQIMDVDEPESEFSGKSEKISNGGPKSNYVPDIRWDPSQFTQTHDSFQVSRYEPRLPSHSTAFHRRKQQQCRYPQWVPPSNGSSRSLQDEYERSRQKLVISMMRSQETRRYVRQLQRSVSMQRDLRDEMISTLSSGSMPNIPCSNIAEL